MFGHPSLDSAGHPFLHQNVGGIVDAQQSGSIFAMKGILHVSLEKHRGDPKQTKETSYF